MPMHGYFTPSYDLHFPQNLHRTLTIPTMSSPPSIFLPALFQWSPCCCWSVQPRGRWPESQSRCRRRWSCRKVRCWDASRGWRRDVLGGVDDGQLLASWWRHASVPGQRVQPSFGHHRSSCHQDANDLSLECRRRHRPDVEAPRVYQDGSPRTLRFLFPGVRFRCWHHRHQWPFPQDGPPPLPQSESHEVGGTRTKPVGDVHACTRGEPKAHGPHLKGFLHLGPTFECIPLSIVTSVYKPIWLLQL